MNAKNICKPYFLPCKECQSENKKNSAINSTKDKVKMYEKLKEYCKSKGGYVISPEWITAKTVYLFKCGNPDHPVFESTADSLTSGNHWCPYCSGRAGNFEEEIKEIIESKNGELLSSYKSQYSYVEVKCNEHDYVWNIMPLNIKKGRWCPICNLPFSEKVVWDFLRDNNIKNQIQYKFNDLKGENNESLKYDFALFDDNNQLYCLLEIDDCEHWYNHKSQRRIKARQRDKIKDEYCRINSIPLFRMILPYKKDKPSYKKYYSYIERQIGFLIKGGLK